jgi:hypothetical protein
VFILLFIYADLGFGALCVEVGGGFRSLFPPFCGGFLAMSSPGNSPAVDASTDGMNL